MLVSVQTTTAINRNYISQLTKLPPPYPHTDAPRKDYFSTLKHGRTPTCIFSELSSTHPHRQKLANQTDHTQQPQCFRSHGSLGLLSSIYVDSCIAFLDQSCSTIWSATALLRLITGPSILWYCISSCMALWFWFTILALSYAPLEPPAVTGLDATAQTPEITEITGKKY